MITFLIILTAAFLYGSLAAAKNTIPKSPETYVLQVVMNTVKPNLKNPPEEFLPGCFAMEGLRDCKKFPEKSSFNLSESCKLPEQKALLIIQDTYKFMKDKIHNLKNN